MRRGLLFRLRENTFSIKQKIRDMKSVPLINWMLLLLAIAAVPGCATHALWAEAELGTHHGPADDSALRLFRCDQPRDLLVLYQEASGRHDRGRIRAYRLYQNASRMEQGRPPRFLRIDSTIGLEPVPVYHAANAVPASPTPPLYAIVSGDKVWFTLYANGAAVGSYSLPAYGGGLGTMERIALTPLAFTADATIVGGAIAAVAAAEVYQNGWRGPP
jgi:hypothetical protein